MNGSLDFLNMIRNSAQKHGNESPKRNDAESNNTQHDVTRRQSTIKQHNMTSRQKVESKGLLNGSIAVIDTETNWNNQVMSLGIAVADGKTFSCVDKRYYIFEPECYIGGMYSGVLHYGKVDAISLSRQRAMEDIRRYLDGAGVQHIYAYNAKFDKGHLPELGSYDWHDIMRIAAYKQFNSAIPDSLPCCKSGRLKSNYGVEPIMQMLTGNMRYREVHNAIYDAVDELKIVELLGHPVEIYECAKI